MEKQRKSKCENITSGPSAGMGPKPIRVVALDRMPSNAEAHESLYERYVAYPDQTA
jgi:hypothetical protein